jgi:photosystem II stability/assembly factor-like uncharacterized protein
MFFRRVSFYASALICACAILLPAALHSKPKQSSNSTPAATVPEGMYSNLRWRLIGPFRAGKASCITGVEGNTSTYYMGTPGGGVWRTVDGGRVWAPVFDEAKVASIGAVAVARTNRNIIYVGTGYETPGDGVWKSTDGAKTWRNTGLQDTKMISAILVDPKNPDIVFVAAPGNANSGENRGVYKTTDGGANWKKVLYLDPQSGVISISFAPDATNVIFASFQVRTFGRQATEHGIYKSTDAGETWQPVGGEGLPKSGMGKIGVLVAPSTGGERIYAIMNQGFFRSDDGGATWQRATDDARIVSTGQFGQIFSNPQDPNDIFISQTSMYRSQDGGHTWNAFTGAPSGDDYNFIWVNPDYPRFMAQAVDQGAVVSEDGGKTWSSWYNQPTGQLYHVITDNQFPYIVYAAQQDSGTVAVPSRSDYGEIGDNERFSIAGFEAAYIAPDPLNPNWIYSNAWYGSVIRYDRSTGQLATVFVRTDKYRTASMAPLAYAPQDPKALYLGTQYLMRTTNGGVSWQEISPDLTEVPKTAQTQPPDAAQAARRGGPGGALSTVSFSTVKAGVIWTGSTNGRIHMTPDGGKHWNDVTPADLPSPANIEIIDSSHFDTNSAYVAVASGGRGGGGAPGPEIFRTHDLGKSWQKIVNGLPTDPPGLDSALFVRQDTVSKNLLFAGTQSAMWVSFDDGDHWQSLQLNLPTAQMRDLVVKGNDLVLVTYGRSIWVLDDVTPLRNAQTELASGANPLYSPPDALRWRWDNYQDTPPTVEMAAASGKNPPDGAIIDYYLPNATSSATIEITDSKGDLVRKYTSEAPAEPKLKPNVPDYWFAPPTVVGTSAGPHRFVWDLRYPDPVILPYNYYGFLIDYTEYTLADHAIPGELPRGQPFGALAAPGNYTVTLTVDGQSYKQPLRLTEDPRVHATQADLEAQVALAQRITHGLQSTTDTFWQVKTLADAIVDRQKSLASASNSSELTGTLKTLADQVHAIDEGTPAAPGIGPGNRDLTRIFTMIESGDMRPTDSAQAAVNETCGQIDSAFAAWRNLNASVSPTSIPAGADAKPTVLLSSVNSQLTAASLAPLPVATNIPAISPCGK